MPITRHISAKSGRIKVPVAPLRVAISPCPNDVAVFSAWILGLVPWAGPKVEFSFHDIQQLNELGLSDTAPDVLKFSYAVFPKLQKTYELAEVGSALGTGVGPLIVGHANMPLGECREMLIPGWDTTAALLCQRYAPAHVPRRVMRYDQILRMVAMDDALAGVIIHESRFSYAEHGLSLLLDLGTCWENETRLPLPLGGVGIRRHLAADVRQEFENTIRSSLDFAQAHPEQVRGLIKQHAQEMADDKMARHIALYVNDYTRELGATGRRAVELLCEMKKEPFG